MGQTRVQQMESIIPHVFQEVEKSGSFRSGASLQAHRSTRSDQRGESHTISLSKLKLRWKKQSVYHSQSEAKLLRVPPRDGVHSIRSISYSHSRTVVYGRFVRGMTVGRWNGVSAPNVPSTKKSATQYATPSNFALARMLKIPWSALGRLRGECSRASG